MEISGITIENWAKIELLLKIGTFKKENMQKEFADKVLKMDIPTWVKIWFLMKTGVSQDESEHPYGFMRMVLYGVWNENLGLCEETPQRQLELSPLEAFLYKLHKLSDLAESNGNEEVIKGLEEIKESVLAHGDFTFENCLELRRIEEGLINEVRREGAEYKTHRNI
ncbi:hypothetical protein [Thermococcus sp.]